MMERKESHKPHRKSSGGKKLKKNQQKKSEMDKEESREKCNKERNFKAFSMYSAVRAGRAARRALDLATKKHHLPVPIRTVATPPPYVIVVVGPPKVGKTTLIRSLIKHYTKQKVVKPIGPITIISGKNKKLTFMECNNDLNSMIDLAKVADLVLMIIDASFGFEMETFEFLNILQVHGFPKVMGVLTHLDLFKQNKRLNKIKKRLKHRFWTEIYQGAKLFYLSGMIGDGYHRREIMNLSRFISVMKFRPLVWRSTHPYVLVDRVEDLTDPELVKRNPTTARTVSFYGYSRGISFKPSIKIHIPGVGDLPMKDVSFLPDPCPLPEEQKKRKLLEKETLIYAPMCDVGETLYDKDAVYVEMGQNVRKLDLSSGEKDILVGEGVGIVNQLVKAAAPIDEACKASTVKLFAASSGIKGSADVFEGVRSDALGTETEPNPRIRRKVVFSDVESESDSGLRWKEHMADKAEQAFLQPRPPDLMGAVYNTNHTSAINSLDESEPEDDDFFSKERHEKVGDQEIAVTEDSSKIRETGLHWDEEDVQKLLRNKFVTGEWGSEDAEKLLMEDEESDADGDFEDLEIASSEHKAEESPRDVVQQSDRLRYEEKVLKKAEFDRMYDNKDNDGLFQEMKESFAKQARINESEFENEAAEQRIQYEGFRPGLYLRIVVENVPSEFCQHLDPSYPIIIGGLLSNEENIGFVHVRIKKHRWFPRILKNNDPLIISLGWRRFQTAMQYSMQDHNMRNRLLKYTPKHMHCRATFYGPLVTPNTGFLGVQTVDRTPGFRIAATGVVLEQDACFKVVKKLKLTGVPHKVFTNTAFIKDMFTSDLEVSKFIGASIRTVSGIRGTIKKTLSAPLGSFRATFEDKIKLSDIVFLRAWYPVEPLRYYNPVTSLLQADKGSWTGMKTVGQLRFERNLKARCKADSHYKLIKREPVQFSKLTIPKSLQAELPYKSKPKLLIKKSEKTVRKQKAKKKIFKIMSKEEKQINVLLQQLNTIKNLKLTTKLKKKQEADQRRAKELEKDEAKALKRQKAWKKQINRKRSKREGVARRKSASAS